MPRGCLCLLHPTFCPSSAHSFSCNLSSGSNFLSSAYVAALSYSPDVLNLFWFTCSVFSSSDFSVDHSAALAAAVVAEEGEEVGEGCPFS